MTVLLLLLVVGALVLLLLRRQRSPMYITFAVTTTTAPAEPGAAPHVVTAQGYISVPHILAAILGLARRSG